MVERLDVSLTGVRLHNARGFLRSYGHVLLLALLIVAQIAINWSWLSTNVNVIGWDRPRHLIESLVYNDILQRLSLGSLFEAWTYSGYYPPLFHLSMVAFYKLFGVSMDVAAVVNTVYLVLLLISAYGIGREIGGKRVGLLTAFITSTLPMVFAMSRYTYIEFSLTAMVAVSIWLLLSSKGFAHKGYSLLFGLSLGFGLLTKWTFSLFIFPALIVVILRARLLSKLRKGRRLFSVGKRWLGVSLASGLVLTLIWYLPNAQRITRLPLSCWLLPISWLLLTGLIYLLRQPSHSVVNLLGGLWLGLVVAGSWYMSRLDFISHTFFIAWGRPQRQTWAFEYYLDRLIHEQLSLPYAVVLLVAGVGLLILRWKRCGQAHYWRQTWRSDLFLLSLWIVVPYLVFSFRPSSRHSRFIMPILPAAAAIIAYGLFQIRFRAARALSIAGVVLFGGVQCLSLSFDSLSWASEATTIELPVFGRVSLFANGPQNQLPSSGPTDSRFWIVPDVLDYVVTHSQASEPVEIGLLLNTQQINEQHFQYLIYTDYRGQVETRELALNLANNPVYPRLFEMDYLLLMTDHLRHRINPDSLEMVEAILNDPPAVFQEAFHLARTYPLPDGSSVRLYERRYPLPPNWSYEASQALAGAISAQSGLDDAIIIFPEEQINALGPYYQGDAAVYLLSEERLDNEQLVVNTVDEVLALHSRVFTVAESSGKSTVGNLVASLLNERAYLTSCEWYGSAELRLYAAPEESAGLSIQQPLDVRLGEDIALIGYSLAERDSKAGAILRLTLFWQARGLVAEEYRVFAQLLDAEGGSVAWTDCEPVGGSWPTTAWRDAEIVVDNHGLLIPRYIWPGRYDLVAGMYLPITGERLSPSGEGGQTMHNAILLDTISVTDE